MSIYDRARDAVRPKPPLVIPHDNPYGFAAEVVRLHDELSALADELDASGERRRFDASPYEQAAGVAQVVDAARIREVIERDKA